MLRGQLEAQRGTAVLWAPVALAFGIWLYFSLPQEPTVTLTCFIAILAAALLTLARARAGITLIAIFLLGFVLAKSRAEMVATPLLKATTGDIAVAGIVTDSDGSSAKRGMLLLQPTAIEGLTPDQMPRLLRLSFFSRNGGADIGARIAFKARLAPIPSPAMPGGFDYGRALYFQSIGGTGRITSKIEVSGAANSGSLWLPWSVHELRGEIGGRIRRYLTGPVAAVAEAMITGERAAIPNTINRSLQISGLAHILSISGLHMSLAAGGVFWVARAFLAAFPRLALNYPIKKWAAVAALAFGFIYMLLAGSQAATQRSYIMLAVVFLAIILDRPAVSLRNLALAALLILAMQPESAVQASFQMSFMAVMGLAAFFEFWNRRGAENDYHVESKWRFYSRKAFKLTVASVLTTLVAGGFSSIPAAYHFGRLAPYGVIANGLAIPVMSFVVMPFALLSVVLMPFGLESLAVAILGKGVGLVLAISEFVAALPGAQQMIPQLPLASALGLAVAAAIMCLARQKAKLLAVPVVAAALFSSQLACPPDILVERTAANVAFRNGAGELVFALGRKGRFAGEKWLQANGEEAGFMAATQRPGWACEGRNCLTTVHGKALAYFQDGEGPEPSCAGLDIIVANYPLRNACKAVRTRIDRFDVWRFGAQAISITNGDVSVTTARGLLGNRPWVVVPEPRRGPALLSGRGASTHSPFGQTRSFRGHEQDTANHFRFAH